MPDRASTGEAGESAALRYLEGKGYEVLATRWRCGRGELDIVARQGEMLVFVEVKTRRGDVEAGAALAAISVAKRERLIAAAYAYIADSGLEDPPWRIDAIAVVMNRHDRFEIVHVEDALDW